MLDALVTIVILASTTSAPCPPTYDCFKDGPTFANAVNATCTIYKRMPDGFEECTAWRSARLGLLCNATDPCTITRTRLNIGLGVSVIMRHVAFGPNEFSLAAGGLMIVNGNASCEHLTFTNGSSAGNPAGFGGVPAGAVYVMPGGNFTCDDCGFFGCTSMMFGGAVSNYLGALHLRRAVFEDNVCLGCGPNGGQACYCEIDRPLTSSQSCEGCECAEDPSGVCSTSETCEYCDNADAK
mmetsp:Transcript_31277/g.81719  ORF Transcript_31277/g.81719 Transcript_31277/m.81719 type:complete len:239 (-) Transcript_31277:33-749(-)